jgi:hypothetical protein
VPEVRRLVAVMGDTAEQQPFRLGWSRWRRAHQAVAAPLPHHAAYVPPAGPAPRSRCTATSSGRGGADRRRVAFGPTAAPSAAAGEGATSLRPSHRARWHPLGGALGASWRAMPSECGKGEAAYQRYRLWCATGLWPRLLEALSEGNH